jgi:hypothetical protein
VIVTHGDGGVSHKVEHKDELDEYKYKSLTLTKNNATHHHECRGKEDPADVPIPANSVPDHLLNAEVELLSSKHPTDGDSLEEHTPQQRQATGSIEVHQLKHVNTALGIFS